MPGSIFDIGCEFFLQYIEHCFFWIIFKILHPRIQKKRIKYVVFLRSIWKIYTWQCLKNISDFSEWNLNCGFVQGGQFKVFKVFKVGQVKVYTLWEATGAHGLFRLTGCCCCCWWPHFDFPSPDQWPARPETWEQKSSSAKKSLRGVCCHQLSGNQLVDT